MIRWALHMAEALKKSQNREFCLSEWWDNKGSANLKQVAVFFGYLGSWNKGAAPNKESWDPDMVKGHLQCSDRFSTSTAQHMGAHIDPSTFHLLFQKEPCQPLQVHTTGWNFFLPEVVWSLWKGRLVLLRKRRYHPGVFQGKVLGITATVPSQARGLLHQLDQGTMLGSLLYKVIIKFTNTSLNIDQPS